MRFFLALAMLAGPSAASDLDSYRWENRLLVVSFSDCDLRDAFERTWARSGEGARERDLLVIRADEKLRRELGWSENANTVWLIGKDGTTKARWNHPPEPSEVFGIIDSMPMRRREAGQK